MSALGMLAHLLGWPLTGPHALGFFLTPALCVYFVFVFVAPLTWGLPILTRLPSGRNTIALTFDDGPSAETTPEILDVLCAEGVHATFFVLGEAVARHPALTRQMLTDGHAVGIHGFHHAPFVLLSRRAIAREIAEARAALHTACPDVAAIPWVRPPHGFKSLTLSRTLCRLGFGLAAWSVDSRDYRDTDPERIAARVLGQVRPGAIVLLHDGPANTATAAALPLILRGLEERGLEIERGLEAGRGSLGTIVP